MSKHFKIYFLLKLKILSISLILLSLYSCSRKSEDDLNKNQILSHSETVYAKEFGYSHEEGYIRLWIAQSDRILTEYFLIPTEAPIPDQLKGQSNLIRTPVRSVVCTSTTQVPWLDLLESSNLLTGFPDPGYLYSAVQRSRFASGELKDLGGNSGLESEGLVELKPDLILSFSGRTESQQEVLLEKINTTLVQTREHLEAHPLGRAEWIRFMGILLDKELMADSIFNSVVTAYEHQSMRNFKNADHPVVITGIPYGGIWHMPGGGSYAAMLFHDAGFDYPWAEEQAQAVIPLSFEKVFPVGIQADVWIGASNHQTIDQLILSEKRFKNFRSVMLGQVWVYDHRSLPKGGNDYFESAGVRPDLVLKDLIGIRTGKTDSLYFYRKLN